MTTSADGLGPPLVVSAQREALGLYQALRKDRGQGGLIRLRRGAYADGQVFRQLSREDQYLMRVAAAVAVRKNAVLAGISAAIRHGLPLVGLVPETVFLLSPTRSGRRRNQVVEIPRTGREHVVELDGFRVTDLADTLIEVCRTAPFITALVMVDAALHIERFGDGAGLVSFDELMAAHNDRMPYRGSARVLGVLAASTTQAASPFETLSRVTSDELGFPEPELQFELVLSNGETVYFDFGWPKWRVGGEADGWGKYVNPKFPSSDSLEERIKAEKRRDNAVRRTGWTPAHWDWADAWHRAPMRAILLDAGLPIVRPPRTIR